MNKVRNGGREMEQSLQVNRMLHDEHVAVIGLLERFQAFLAEAGTSAPATGDPAAGRMLSDVAGAIETEITAHFRFEEEDLFPCLDAAGYGDLGETLTEDHRVILPMGQDLARLARSGQGDGFTADSWADFRRLGGEFAERLIAHARNEETGLLPVLELAVAEDADTRMAAEYAMKR